MSKKIIVIGGSAAGSKAAAKARRMDETAEITMFQKGPDLSMASCGFPILCRCLFRRQKTNYYARQLVWFAILNSTGTRKALKHV